MAPTAPQSTPETPDDENLFVVLRSNTEVGVSLRINGETHRCLLALPPNISAQAGNPDYFSIVHAWVLQQMPAIRKAIQKKQAPSTRREFFTQAGILGTGAVASAVRTALENREQATGAKESESRSRESLAAPSAENFATGEFSRNKIETFMAGFTSLDRKHIILVDQNGNMIGGEPIPIPDDLLKMEGKADFKDRFNRWLNTEREQIKQKYPTVFVRFDPNREEPTLLNVRGALSNEDDERGDGLFASIWQNANEPVSEKKHQTRLEYIREQMEKSNIPPELQRLFIGACATESGFNEMPPNKVGASGFWQIMPDEAQRFGLMGTRKEKVDGVIGHTLKRLKIGRKWIKKITEKIGKVTKTVPFDDRNKLEKSTSVAIKLFEERYKKWSDPAFEQTYEEQGKQKVRTNCIRKVQALYGVSDEDFLHPAVVNTYHSGETRINRMMEWFLKQYSPEQVARVLGPGPYGRDLYTFITSVYVHSQKEDKLFGKSCRDYTIRAAAMAELLDAKKEDTMPEPPSGYTPPASPRSPEDDMTGKLRFAAHRVWESGHIQTVGVGAVMAVTALAVSRVLKGPLTRRELLKRSSLALGAAYGGRYLGARAEAATRRNMPEAAPKPESPKDMNPRQFEPYILDENGVRDFVIKSVPAKLKISPRTFAEVRKTKDPLHIGLDVAKRLKLPRFDMTRDIASAPNMAAWNQCGTPFYRLRGVGSIENGIKNDTRFCYSYPHTQELVRKIDEELNRELQKVGFPKNIWVRLIVQSASRSLEFQQNLRKNNQFAARGESPHMFGHTVDIHRHNFDLIVKDGTPNEKFTMVKPGDGINAQLALSPKINAVLGRVIAQMKQRGELTVIDEGSNPVYHLSDTKPTGV